VSYSNFMFIVSLNEATICMEVRSKKRMHAWIEEIKMKTTWMRDDQTKYGVHILHITKWVTHTTLENNRVRLNHLSHNILACRTSVGYEYHTCIYYLGVTVILVPKCVLSSYNSPSIYQNFKIVLNCILY